MDTTIDEARRCSKCGELGRESNVRSLPRNAREVAYQCQNSRCRWYGQICSVVTIRADGSIPDPTTNRQKFFTKPAVDRTAQVQEMLDRQLQAERGRDNEIRNR